MSDNYRAEPADPANWVRVTLDPNLIERAHDAFNAEYARLSRPGDDVADHFDAQRAGIEAVIALVQSEPRPVHVVTAWTWGSTDSDLLVGVYSDRAVADRVASKPRRQVATAELDRIPLLS